MTRLSRDVQPELSGHSALSVIRHYFSLKLTFLLQNRLLPTFFCVLTLPIVYLHHAKLLVSLSISVRKEKPLIKLEALHFPTAKPTCFCSRHLASSRLLWISCASVSPPFIFGAGVHTLSPSQASCSGNHPPSLLCWASLVALIIEETQFRSLDWEDPLEKELETHSRILAWRIPWTEEPGGLQSMGSQRVGHNWTRLPLHFLLHYHFFFLLDHCPHTYTTHYNNSYLY